MSSSRRSSPTRSLGSVRSPQYQKTRRSRSDASLVHSNVSVRSGRLSSMIQEYRERNMGSFVLSPLVRKSILSDNTDIEEPRRKSWWTRLDENSRDVMDVLEESKATEPNNIIEELDIEVLSQGKKNYTLDLPESSDSESIISIVMPQRKLFNEKENQPQKKFEQFGTRETLSKLHKTNSDKSVSAETKELFQNKPRSRPMFPSALLNISPNKTSDTTLVPVEPKGQVRNIFGNRQGTKRKNMFANFILSESEDEIPEIQSKVFGFQNYLDVKSRPSSYSRGIRDHSPTSSITTDMELDDWKLLPSSTMVENQLEAMMSDGHTSKKAKLSKLSEAKESDAATTSTETEKSKQSNKSTTSINKSKTMTKEKSPEQNIYITTRNKSNLSTNKDEKANKSQGRINKSINKTSPTNNDNNKSQSSRTTRSKNKSGFLDSKQDSSVNKSRSNSSEVRQTSKNSSNLTVNKDTSKKAKLSKLSEAKESDAATTSTETEKSKQSNKSTTSKNKSKTMTKEKSPEQNISITTRNKSNLSTNKHEKANKSQGRINKSINKTSPTNNDNNKSQSSRTTRSKNKSGFLDSKQDSSVNNSRSNSSEVRQTSKNSSNLTVNKDLVSNNHSSNNLVREIEQIPQNDDDDDELNFTLEYENDDNADEVDMPGEAKQQNTSVINKSNKQANASQRKYSTRNVSKTDKSLQKAVVNKIDEESAKSVILSQGNEKPIDSHKQAINEDKTIEDIACQQELSNYKKISVQHKSLREHDNMEVDKIAEVGEELEIEGEVEQQEVENDDNDSSQKKQIVSQHIQNESQKIQDQIQEKQNMSKDIQDKIQEEENVVQFKSTEIQDESQVEENVSHDIHDESQVEENVSQDIQDESREEENVNQDIQDESQEIQDSSKEEQSVSHESQHLQNEIEEQEKESESEKNEQESEIEVENEEQEIESEVENEEQENMSEIEYESEAENEVQENEIEVENEEQKIESEVENEEPENMSEIENEREAENEVQENEIEVENEEQEIESEVENEEQENMSEIEYESEAENEVQENEIEVENEEQKIESEVENEEPENMSEIENEREAENEIEVENEEQEIESEVENEEQENMSEIENENQENESEAENKSQTENEYEENIDSQEVENESEDEQQNNSQEVQNDSEEVDDQQEMEYDEGSETPDESHDTTNQTDSLEVHGRHTTVRKSKSMIKNLNIRPSLNPVRDSISLPGGTTNSSAEGSCWDSHRTTRKTLRQTFGKDFTPRKSLRALVMEKSAKRYTVHNDLTSVTAKFPQANSTELPEASAHHVYDDVEIDQEAPESDHEVSRRTRLTTLETYLQKIKKDIMENNAKLKERVRNSLKTPPQDIYNPFKVPAIPKLPRRPIPKVTKPKTKRHNPFMPVLPEEVLEDLKYKPPKRFQPRSAPWITKRLYNFLEKKLEPKYDYKARVRAEKLMQLIYKFTVEMRRREVASPDAVSVLKQEMARLDVVNTHFDFYDFVHEYLPREVRVKVIPNLLNNIPLPKHGVFSDIL